MKPRMLESPDPWAFMHRGAGLGYEQAAVCAHLLGPRGGWVEGRKAGTWSVRPCPKQPGQPQRSKVKGLAR